MLKLRKSVAGNQFLRELISQWPRHKGSSMTQLLPWLQAALPIPETFNILVSQFWPEAALSHAAQLLWQRNIRQQLAAFLDAAQYQPTDLTDADPAGLGLEVTKAVDRLRQAGAEKVALWGEADVAGITSTALLWQGFSQLFGQPHPHLTARGSSPGADLTALVAEGYSLLIVCGRRDWAEQAEAAGLAVILLDRACPTTRPSVTAWLNPRCLPAEHPLANLPTVALAYKLMEALYQSLGDQSLGDQSLGDQSLGDQSLGDQSIGSAGRVTDLLDLVAVGLLADPVRLTGESRYLAQLGIACLQRHQDSVNPPRPGLAKLLQLCRITGDRPTNIASGLGPRIQAISRLWADQRCLELLTSQDHERCAQLAEQAELANLRCKVLQRQVVTAAKAKLAEIDLSTTRVILLSDPQWPTAILALAAGELADEYGRPVILLSESTESAALVSGSARAGSSGKSEPLDLCEFLQQQAIWLGELWGAGAAAELSLPSQNIEPLAEALNQQARAMGLQVEQPQADLAVTVAELGKALFQELRRLEPYGLGNPAPRLLLRDCWLTQVWHRKVRDLSGSKLNYIKTEFELWDKTVSQGFPGVWWGHYKDELPVGQCDLLVELEFSSYEDAKRQRRYEVRLIAIRPSQTDPAQPPAVEILDWRQVAERQSSEPLIMRHCPASWAELKRWVEQAQQAGKPLALAYDLPVFQPPVTLWQTLLETVQSRAKPGETLPLDSLQAALNLSEQTLSLGLVALEGAAGDPLTASEAFVQAVAQEQFMQRYFCQVSLATMLTALQAELSVA